MPQERRGNNPEFRRGPNPGPSAAAANRRAILTAARQVFAERGYHAPLSAIARQAGVGQGVLYRHFPSRLDLAFATFEDNFAEFEQLAADPNPTTLERMWRRLIDLTIQEVAFIEMLVDARRTYPDYNGAERMQDLLDQPLQRAIAAGRVHPALTVADLMLGPRIAYGIVATAVDGTDLHAAVAQALAISGRLPSPTAAD